MLEIKDRLTLLAQLRTYLEKADDEYLQAVMQRTAYHNDWFTLPNQRLAMQQLAEELEAEKLQTIADQGQTDHTPRRVGVLLGGRYPLDGVADWIPGFLLGHQSAVKLHEDDPYLFPALLRQLKIWSEAAAATTDFVQQLSGVDEIIGTVTKQALPAFKKYFGHLPHQFRTEQRAVAVLNGEETPDQLQALGRQVFDFFGLAPTSIGKLYLPNGYDFTPLLEALHEYRDIVHHSKYKNNFDYNYSLAILNKEQFQANGCMLLFEEATIFSRIATLHYSFYDQIENAREEIAALGTDCSRVWERGAYMPNLS